MTALAALAALVAPAAKPLAPPLPQAGAQYPHPTGDRRQSTVGNPCAVVWAVADSMPGARACDVVARCVALGVNPNTATRQRYLWSKARGVGAAAAPRPPSLADMTPEALAAWLAEAQRVQAARLTALDSAPVIPAAE